MPRIAKIKLELYKFNELSKKSQNILITEYINFLIEQNPSKIDNPPFHRAIEEVKRLQTPWFFPQALYQHCVEGKEGDIFSGEEYTKDGTLYDNYHNEIDKKQL